jgi:hypothetical protein
MQHDSELARIAEAKANFLLLYKDSPDSFELKQHIDILHTEATQLGLSIDDVDTEALPILERNNFFVHNAIRVLPKIESMPIADILVVWRAVYAEGRFQNKVRHFASESMPQWLEWSGSAWVAARWDMIVTNGSKTFEATLHCSFPPGRKPQMQREHEVIQKYGRWITETEWEPPPAWPDDVKDIIVNANALTEESMTIAQILMAWRAIYTEGGLRIDTTRYVSDSLPTWADWSGSNWVRMLVEKLGMSPPHMALPPGWNPQTEHEHNIARNYGRWITETEWEPPKNAVFAETKEIPKSQDKKTKKWWWMR